MASSTEISVDESRSLLRTQLQVKAAGGELVHVLQKVSRTPRSARSGDGVGNVGIAEDFAVRRVEANASSVDLQCQRVAMVQSAEDNNTQTLLLPRDNPVHQIGSISEQSQKLGVACETKESKFPKPSGTETKNRTVEQLASRNEHAALEEVQKFKALEKQLASLMAENIQLRETAKARHHGPGMVKADVAKVDQPKGP